MLETAGVRVVPVGALVIVFVCASVQNQDLEAPVDAEDGAKCFQELDVAELATVLLKVGFAEQLLLSPCIASNVDVSC